MSDIAYVYTSYFLENFFTDSSWIVPQISSKLPPEIRQRILLGFFWDSCISFDTDSIWRFLEFSSTFLNLTSNLFRNIFILLYENLLYRFIREFLFFFEGFKFFYWIIRILSISLIFSTGISLDFLQRFFWDFLGYFRELLLMNLDYFKRFLWNLFTPVIISKIPQWSGVQWFLWQICEMSCSSVCPSIRQPYFIGILE